MAADADAVPVASDDVDGVQWVQVDKLRQLESEFESLQCCLATGFCWLPAMRIVCMAGSALRARSACSSA